MFPICAAVAVVGLGLAALVALYLVIIFASWIVTEAQNRHLPGPKPAPILGHLDQLQKAGGFHHLLKLWGAEHGNFLLYIGLRTWFMVQDPDLISIAALKLSKDMPHRGPYHQGPHTIGAYGREFRGTSQLLLSSTDNSWKSVRAPLNSLFKPNAVVRLLPALCVGSERLVKELLAAAEGQNEVNVHPIITRQSLRNVLMISCGIDVDADTNQPEGTQKDGHTHESNGGSTLRPGWEGKVTKLRKSAEDVFEAPVFDFVATQIISFLPLWLQPYASVLPFHLAASFPTQERKLYKARQYVANMMLAEVNRARRMKGQPVAYNVSDQFALGDPGEHCLIQALTDSKNSETKKNFDDLAIAYHAFGFVLAGEDTTSTALTFTLYFLAKYKEHQQRCAKECKALNFKTVRNLDDLKAALQYTYACFNEAMRIYPPGFVSSRQALKKLEVGPYKISKGTNVGFNIIAMHHNPKYFPDPKKYRPERFLPGPEMDSRHQWAFMPFGIGHRDCIGKNFAVMSALVLLAHILKDLTLELDAKRLDDEIPLNPGGITLAPMHGVWLKLYPRN